MNGKPNHLIALAALVFLVSVVALVVLELAGRPTANLMALVGPVVAALLVSGHVSNLTRDQNQTIARIETNTNGVLDERIRTQTKVALRETMADRAPLITEAPHNPDEYHPAHGADRDDA